MTFEKNGGTGFLKNLRVANRLAIGFGTLAVLMLLSGLFSMSRMSQINSELDRVVNVRWVRVQRLQAVVKLVNGNARNALAMLIASDPAERQRLQEQQNANREGITTLLRDVELSLEAARGRELFSEITRTRTAFVGAWTHARQVLNTDPVAAHRLATLEMIPAQEAYQAAIDALLAFQQNLVNQSVAVGAEAYASARNLTTLLVLFFMALSIFTGYFITQSITRPLLAAVGEAGKVAEGRFQMESVNELDQVTEAFGFVQLILKETVDLKNKVQQENKDMQSNIMNLLTVVSDASDGNLTARAKVSTGALGNVADAFNSLIESLQILIGNVSLQIDQTNQTVSSMTASSSTMASGVTHQANEVQTAKKLVDKSTDDIKRVGEAAQSAANAAKRAEDSATEGATAIQNIIGGMDQLRQNVQAGAKKMKNLGDRSMEITGIVDTISRISEQTNMLALNAAIEAARAGEHGRGFSVVAEEVRKLAERTATATQEIAKLVSVIHQETSETVAAIEKQTQVVEQESALVSKAGQTLLKIREVSSESASLVNGISLLTKAQIEGTNVVGRAIAQISQIAQSTLLGVEGTVTTLGQLTRLSTELTQSVRKFKVKAN